MDQIFDKIEGKLLSRVKQCILTNSKVAIIDIFNVASSGFSCISVNNQKEELSGGYDFRRAMIKKIDELCL